MQSFERRERERGHYQQDRIGAGRTSFENLIAIDDEVLAQYRQLGRRPNGREMIEMPIEERRFSEYGDRRGAGPVVPLRNRCRIVVGFQNAARWRAALAFGNDVEAVRSR